MPCNSFNEPCSLEGLLLAVELDSPDLWLKGILLQHISHKFTLLLGHLQQQ